MTEKEWLGDFDSHVAFAFWTQKATNRKLRLFACASWHLAATHFGGREESRQAVALAEQYADGVVEESARLQAQQLATAGRTGIRQRQYRNEDHWRVAPSVAEVAVWATEVNVVPRGIAVLQMPEVRHLIRDIFGNPFRPVTVSPVWLAWNSGTVPKLAQTIYDERAFNRMPVLADALEEAGCTNADLLDHCRQPADHFRGCWVIDLLLGKN